MQSIDKLIFDNSLVALSKIRTAVFNLGIGVITKDHSIELIKKALEQLDKENEEIYAQK